MLIKIILIISIVLTCNCVDASRFSVNSLPSLPFCPNITDSGVILVSTLDGKVSALNSSGNLIWAIETGQSPLLTSNIHNLELTNNGEWIRIIPSLSGTLYKFDGATIDPVSISVEKLLKSSLKYSDDLVMAGGIEIRTYGVGFNTGQLLYECNRTKCSSMKKEEMEDVLIIERSIQTVRAIEPRTGTERWNFSVGLHNIKLPQVSCINIRDFNMNISAIIPKGLLSVSFEKNNIKHSWQYKFDIPIVKIWEWNGVNLSEINLFAPKDIPAEVLYTQSVYIGMHNRQLYILESEEMEKLLRNNDSNELEMTESDSIAKIPWKPISASSEITEDDSSGLSVLNNSEYVNGNGYYLFNQQTDLHCDNNNTVYIESSSSSDREIIYTGVYAYINFSQYKYFKEFLLMIITVILVPTLFTIWHINKPKKSSEMMIIEKPIETIVTEPSRKDSEKSNESFTSRFLEDYNTIQCLGKGGFGVVFQVKQKYDDCHYAIKRITLPNGIESRNRVMREVKALAKLDHKNIVRYFASWVENPPLGWEKQHDTNLIGWSSTEISTSIETKYPSKRIKSYSLSIDNQQTEFSFRKNLENIESDDSFIVFEDDEISNRNDNITYSHNKTVDHCTISFSSDSQQTESNDTCSNNDIHIEMTHGKFSEHLQRKINWKHPGRKHHSWDMSQNSVRKLTDNIPPTYLYIQIELCKKESLKEWLFSNTERNYIEMLHIFKQILDAVEYVHLRKLIHRDLKPSNIFFSLNGHIKVGDFGLVKDIEDSIDIEFNKKKKMISYKDHTRDVGTTLYMSPELSKSRIYDYKVDIYSLGIILFELLVPFNTNMERIATLTKLKLLKFPDTFQQQFPSEYVLLQHLLSDDPKKRLTTVGIKARPPFNLADPGLTDQHFDLKFI